MYKNLKIGVAVPAYNEESLIQKTITTMPDFVDHIVVINDGSKDNTLKKIKSVQKNDKRILLIDNGTNRGIGYSLQTGIRKAAGLGCDRIAVMAGDAQMDPKYLKPLLEDMYRKDLDFIKGNRFMHFDALKSMPRYRRFGNVLVSILTKFATGYYSIFDTQNGYVVYSKSVVERMPWNLIGERYEFENTILVGLSIIDAKIGDFAMPALYGQEKSTIKLFSTTTRVLRVLSKGFWQRIYYKYIIFSFHPIALFLITGLLFIGLGVIASLWTLFEKIVFDASPTTGTVMLAVLPLILGVQLLLTALVMDVIEEKKT